MRITGQLLRSRSKRPLTQVRYLDLSSTNIVTLNQLELCPKLATLIASNNRLESVPNLDCCPELWKLDLSHNKLQDIHGLRRFSVLGCLVLSNNCLDWSDLEDLHQTHILEFSLHGNPKLEKDPYYRMHVIDSFPYVWMLDGRLITSAERQQVENFFSESELTERPVRHKISRKKRFTPTPLQNLAVNGVFGEKTEHWMKRFPLHEKLTQELDRRRLRYLAFNLQEEFRLQSQYPNINESKTNEEIFTAIIKQRESDREKSNMLLLLLVAALEFDIPKQVLTQTLDIAKLTKIGSHNIKDLFLLPKKQQCSTASLLLSGVKIDRDAKLDDGLYDSLYLCLYDLVCEWHKLMNNHNITRKSGVRNVLASEIVQLFCIVPAFLMFLGKHTGLLELVSSATKENDIVEQLYSLVATEKSKGTKPDEMLQEMGSYILKKVHKKNFQFLHKPAANVLPEKPNPPLRASSYTKSLNTGMEVPQRCQSAPGFVRRGNIPTAKHDITGKKVRKSLSPNVKALERSPALGDQVITSEQTLGHIAAMPKKNIVLVKLDRIAASLQQLRNRTPDNSNRFIYVHKEMLIWNYQGHWKVQEKSKGNKVQPRQSAKEKNSESYLANTIRKQLPVEVWMSFSSLQDSSNNREKSASDSDGNVVTQHVRELVKECIEHAKMANETSIQDGVSHQDDTLQIKKTFRDDKIITQKPRQQQRDENGVQLNETASIPERKVVNSELKENKNMKEQKADSEWEFSGDDNMISRTENERLEAWRFFTPSRNFEERIIADEIVANQPWSLSPRTPCPTSRIEPEENKQDVYTMSGKRISFPLPGWMKDFQSKNRPSSSATTARYKRTSVETERRWAPIILNSTNVLSGTSEVFKRENQLEPKVSRPRRHQSAQVVLGPK